MGSTTISAIVIGSVPYSDSSLIVRVYTKDNGMVPLFIRKTKSKSKRNSSALWHPLAAINVTDLKRKTPSSLGTFTEVDRAIPANNLLGDARRSSVAFFLAEFMDKSIDVDAPMEDLFVLLWNTIKLLEFSEEISNLHFYFLAHVVDILGLMPSDIHEENLIQSLNLSSGEWSSTPPSLTLTSHFLPVKLAQKMRAILGMNFDIMRSLSLKKPERKELLLGMVMFIQLHHAGLKEIKSYEVLETIFSDE